MLLATHKATRNATRSQRSPVLPTVLATRNITRLKVVWTTAVSFQVFKVSSRAASNGRAHALNSIQHCESYLRTKLFTKLLRRTKTSTRELQQCRNNAILTLV